MRTSPRCARCARVMVSMCPSYYRLYFQLVAQCKQYTPRDGDAETCAALASAEPYSEARREAVEKMQEHVKICAECRQPIP